MEHTPTRAEALEQAIVAAGGLTALAGAFGIAAAAVAQWRQNGVPAARVREIERITGVSRHLLRPDIFGAPDEQPEAAE